MILQYGLQVGLCSTVFLCTVSVVTMYYTLDPSEIRIRLVIGNTGLA